jgi:hypothetical protein
MMKVKSVEGTEIEVEGVVEEMMTADPEIKLYLEMFSEKGKHVKDINKMKTGFLTLTKDDKMVLEMMLGG